MRTSRALRAALAVLMVPLVLAACSEKPADAPKAAIPARFVLAAEPANAQPVKEVVAAAKDGDAVVVVGRVSDAVAGLAAFRLVDASLKACNESTMPDECKTPWDFCCTPPEELQKVSAHIELREGAAPVPGDVLGWNGLDHLKTVVVQGQVHKDSAGNVSVAATGVFVRK